MQTLVNGQKQQELWSTPPCPLGKAGSVFGTITDTGRGVQPRDRHVPPLHRQGWLRTPPDWYTLPGGSWPGTTVGQQQ